jgi:hypothetical protein
MSRRAISITLQADNVTWLKGRVGAAGLRSVSELVDRLVTAARESGQIGPSRSVVGTIDVDPGDPLLERADAAVRGMFDMSLSRPLMVNEARAEHRVRPPAPRKRRG